MDLGNGLGHLTYSTLVHPGDDWEQMWTASPPMCRRCKARICANRAVRRVAAAVECVGHDAGEQQAPSATS